MRDEPKHYAVIPGNAEILHQQRGLTIHRNPLNKFTVATLLYWADPAKDNEAWEAEARAGMSEAQFRKEYLIDATALFGEKVFPEITTHRSKIIIDPPDPPLKDVRYFGGFDYGARNPSSFHVYAVDVEGGVTVMWELYEPCKNLGDFWGKVKANPHWAAVEYVAADPSLWSSNQQVKEGNVTSIYNMILECGVYNLIKGVNDEQSWVAGMRKRWADPETITFKIVRGCHKLIEELESAVYSTKDERRMLNKAVKDDIADYNNHAMDDCKYFLNSLITPVTAKREIKWPNMIDRYKT